MIIFNKRFWIYNRMVYRGDGIGWQIPNKVENIESIADII